jgi:hypothetical protein
MARSAQRAARCAMRDASIAGCGETLSHSVSDEVVTITV